MIQNLTDNPSNVVSTDVCIVGAGVAGISLALALAGSGARVALLESGDMGFTKSLSRLPAIANRHLRGAQRWTRGKNVGRPYYPLRFTRARAFGGTSRAWIEGHGLQARPLDPVDFRQRDQIAHSGWPFGRETLLDYYPEAHDISNLGEYSYDVSALDPSLGRPLPTVADGLTTAIFRYGLDSSFDRHVERFRAGETRVFLGATAIAIERGSSDYVQKLSCVDQNGRLVDVSADRYVLAAGALETARLLMVSADINAGADNRDLVGRFFMEHPDVELGHLIPFDDLDHDAFRLYMRQRPGAPHHRIKGMLSLSEDTIIENGLGNSVIRLTRMRSSTMSSTHTLGRWIRRASHRGIPGNIGESLSAIESRGKERVSSHGDWVYRLDMMAEQFPNPDSRVVLGTRRDSLGLPVTHLEWRLLEQDWESIRRTAQIAASALEASGIGRVAPSFDFDNGKPPLFGNWHHLGTTRMHAQADQGVVDAAGKVHGSDNLYVAGGSVFPTGGYANPVLTIVALALRLADHLTATTRLSNSA